MIAGIPSSCNPNPSSCSRTRQACSAVAALMWNHPNQRRLSRDLPLRCCTALQPSHARRMQQACRRPTVTLLSVSQQHGLRPAADEDLLHDAGRCTWGAARHREVHKHLWGTARVQGQQGLTLAVG